jgi:threonine dehydrogenase-like Zn-dependent dehydrogenase
MDALVKKDPVASYELVRQPIPVPVGDEVLIKVEYVAICGSDIALYKWDEIAKKIAALPFTPGHECVGIVESLGPSVPAGTLKVGQRVCVENHFFCGTCFQCTHNAPHICQRMGQFGHGNKTMYGGCSQYSIVRAPFLYELKTGLEPLKAVLLEPFGVSHQACEAAEVTSGDDLLVLGCGPIGLFAVQIAKAIGASKVIAVDIQDSRLALARSFGADVCVNCSSVDLRQVVLAHSDGNGVGHLIEATGAPSLVNASCSFLRKGGVACFVGLPKAPFHVDNVLQDFLFKSITVRTIHGRKIWHTWERAEARL